jgi:hypothetical protein
LMKLMKKDFLILRSTDARQSKIKLCNNVDAVDTMMGTMISHQRDWYLWELWPRLSSLLRMQTWSDSLALMMWKWQKGETIWTVWDDLPMNISIPKQGMSSRGKLMTGSFQWWWTIHITSKASVTIHVVVLHVDSIMKITPTTFRYISMCHCTIQDCILIYHFPFVTVPTASYTQTTVQNVC